MCKFPDNIAVQIPPSGAGSVGAYSAVGDYSAVGCEHTEMDYEDIENKADIPPVDRSLSYSINDYSKTPKLADISQYETPVQILPKVWIKSQHLYACLHSTVCRHVALVLFKIVAFFYLKFILPVCIYLQGKPLPRSSATANYEIGILYVPSQVCLILHASTE